MPWSSSRWLWALPARRGVSRGQAFGEEVTCLASRIIIPLEESLGGAPVQKPRIEVIDRADAAILAAKTPAERVGVADSASIRANHDSESHPATSP